MTTVTLTQVTDPFCTWCWGTEPILRRIEERYREQVEIDFIMGGLVEDFESFSDAANGINDSSDVAPHWTEASEHHGMPVDTDVWKENPPQSSYPANVAYKAAEFQDAGLANRYLRRLRAAVSVERRDISQRAVLIELADDVGLDVDSFTADLASDRAEAAFRRDRQFIRRNPVTAFPTVRVAAEDSETWIRGFQPFETFRTAIESVAADLDKHELRSIPAFVRSHDRVATQEVAEVYEMSPGRTIETLRALEADGRVQSLPAGNGYFWTTGPVDGYEEYTSHGETTTRESISGAACQIGGNCTTIRE